MDSMLTTDGRLQGWDYSMAYCRSMALRYVCMCVCIGMERSD